MERVLVTGGLGRAGPWVIDHLVEEGYEVACVDQAVPDVSPPAVTTYRTDLTDQGATWEVIFEYDPDAILHLASVAIESRNLHGTAVFSANAVMTYNVLVAAAYAGARVAWTSSETVFGPVYDDGEWCVDRLPVDETSPRRPMDAYPASKATGEVIAGMVARRFDLPVASVRPSWVVRPFDDAGAPGPTYETLADHRESFDPGSESLSWNLWSYVDVRDLARLLRTTVEADFEGHERFLAVADENYIGRPTADTAATITGSLPPECDLEGEESAQSNAKAERVLGWTPDHSWRDVSVEDVSAPRIG